MQTSNIIVTASGIVKLLLQGKNYKPIRAIGRINGDTFVTQRIQAHLYHKFNAFGFNYELMRDGSFTWVVVHLPFDKLLVTSRRHILEKGLSLDYKKNCLEKQIFLPIFEFGIEKARATEEAFRKKNERINQYQLFSEVLNDYSQRM